MTELIITSSILIIAILALRLIFHGKMSSRLQYALWALVALRLIIPAPLFSSSLSVMNTAAKLAPVEAAEALSGYEDISYSPDTQTISAYASGDSDRSFPTVVAQRATQTQYKSYETALNIRRVFTRVWTAGIVLCALTFLITNLAFYLRLKIRRRELTGTGAENEYPALRKSKLPVYTATGLSSPCLYGLFRPAIYLTPESLDTMQLDHILTHEMTHFKHGDNLWSALRIVCLCLHWYNPLVWLAAIVSKRDCELSCDEAVIAKLSDVERISYGKTLLSLTCKRGTPRDLFCTATTMTGGKRTIKQRITRIAQKPKMLAGTLAAVILISIFAVGCTFSGVKGGAKLSSVMPEAQTLLNAYVDDASNAEAVKKLAALLPWPEGSKLVDVKKGSDEWPDYLNIDLSITAEKYKAIEQSHTDYYSRNSLLLLALVKNLEEVQISLTDGNETIVTTVTKKWAEIYLQDLAPYMQSAKKLQELMDFAASRSNDGKYVSVLKYVPGEVISAAENLCRERLDEDRRLFPECGYEDWRITYLDSCYDYVSDSGALRVYKLNYEYYTPTPENILSNDEAYYSWGDGWICNRTPCSWYIVFDDKGNYLTSIYRNFCFPGDEMFTQSLNSQLEADGLGIIAEKAMTIDEYMTFLKTVNWQEYFASTGDYEVFTRMGQVFDTSQEALTPEQISVILSSTNGLDGAMTDAYCSLICTIYKKQPTEFAEAFKNSENKQLLAGFLLYADPELDTSSLGFTSARASAAENQSKQG